MRFRGKIEAKNIKIIRRVIKEYEHDNDSTKNTNNESKYKNDI